MSQPPQNGWDHPQSGDPYGQSSPNGYGPGQPGGDGSPSFAPAFGSSEQFPQQPPVKKGPGKWPFIVGGCCVLLVLLIIVAGAGIYFFTRDSGGTEEQRTTGSSTSEEATTE
ncbi:MAG: hypothetical protein ACTIBW_10405, partial [Brachybacterium alimentarium]